MISTLNFQPLNRKEAYTSIDVICPHRPGKHKLKLKVDTGALGNTLPLRDRYVPMMHGKEIVEPSCATLKAYNQICPAIGGLPTCDNLNLVTIHSATTSSEQQGAASGNMPTIRSILDLATRQTPDRQKAHRQTSHEQFEQSCRSDIQQPSSLIESNPPRNNQVKTTRLGRPISPPNRYRY
ncbi:hypothetical protein HOLleu_42353 [Holothuria leucospilota]|uniref:Uncharacterized protein n=1 Tax=Holothuria leucospilota TaxID=206669 RepID=A0A9Q0YAL6_HOLLE|nr:hypothetical protein HOLleu_42353 [Holothuria leucospilota]